MTSGVDLGVEMLEIGPGPGAATDWLRHRVRALTAVELDLAAALQNRVLARLQTLGFEQILIAVDTELRFSARKPAAD